MTLAEAQTVRTAILAGITTAYSTGVSSYAINGRTITRLNPTQLLNDLAKIDNLIARLQSGIFTVAKMRPPE